jgi:hypothetical protein
MAIPPEDAIYIVPECRLIGKYLVDGERLSAVV